MSETCQHGLKLTKPCFDCDDHPIPTTESELAAAAVARSVDIPCVIMCDVEKKKWIPCANPVTHWWHPDALPKHKALVCTMHATRLGKVGQKIIPLNAELCRPAGGEEKP